MRDKTVAILEARLGRQFAELIEKRGARALHAPALAEMPDMDRGAIAQLVASLESDPPAAAVFQTGVGSRALFEATDAMGLFPRLSAVLEKTVVAVRGPKPTAVLRARGVRIDAAAKDPFTTDQVLEALANTPVSGRRVLVQRYGATNAGLEQALASRGATVVEVPTYRWSLPADTRPMVALMDALESSRLDAVAVTSASQVHNLFALAEQLGRAEAVRAGLNRTLVASVGPVSTQALRRFGVGVRVEASPPKLGPLVAALERALAR